MKERCARREEEEGKTDGSQLLNQRVDRTLKLHAVDVAHGKVCLPSANQSEKSVIETTALFSARRTRENVQTFRTWIHHLHGWIGNHLGSKLIRPCPPLFVSALSLSLSLSKAFQGEDRKRGRGRGDVHDLGTNRTQPLPLVAIQDGQPSLAPTRHSLSSSHLHQPLAGAETDGVGSGYGEEAEGDVV